MSEKERTLVLQGVPSEIANGVVSMNYNEFIKYFVKVYFEKSKENPELRECRQEVILHNQHIEETLKRIDQLRAASRVLISQQAFLSKSCNRPPQIQTRTVAVYAKISEDNEEEIAKHKSPKDPKVKQDIPKSVSEVGTQTTLTDDDIDKLEKLLPKPTSEISIQTEPDTSDENEAGTKHRAHNPLKRSFSGEDDFFQKKNNDDPLREIIYNRSSSVISDKIIHKIIHNNQSYGKIIREGEPPHKIIRINSPPHRTDPEDEPIRKIDSEIPLHDGILQSKPSRKMRILRKIVRNGKIIRIFEHCENGHKIKSLTKSVGTDSLPQTPVPVSDSLQVAVSSSTADAEMSGCDSPPIIIPCGGSSTPPLPIVITGDSPLPGDPPEVTVPTSNGTHEPTSQSSDSPPPAPVSSSPQGTLRGSGLQVAVRSSGPPQAVVRSGGNRQVAIRSRGPPQVAARNDSPPPPVAVHGNESDTKTDVDSSHPPETMDGPQNENNDDSVASTINSIKDPSPKTADDTDVSLTTTSSNGDLLEVQIKVEDNELLPEPINGGDSTKKKSPNNKQSSTATKSSKTRALSKKSVEVVDLVSDDDDDSTRPSTQAKAPATPKTIIIPIGTAPTTTTSTSSIPSVSILPTLPSAVQVRATSANASPSNLRMAHAIAAQFVNRTMTPRLISRPIGPAGATRLTYLVPLSSAQIFSQMNSSQTLFRSSAPSGNVVTLTPIRPVTQPPGPRGSSSK